jgi:hypothetical protein
MSNTSILDKHAEWQRAKSIIQNVVTFARQHISGDYRIPNWDLEWCREGTSFARSDDGSILIRMKSAYQDLGGGIYYYNEYKSFKSCPTIGAFYTDKRDLAVTATIIHEIAHSIHLHLRRVVGIYGKPHGCTWKIIYAQLRREFVNPHLENQRMLKNKVMRYERAFVAKIVALNPHVTRV